VETEWRERRTEEGRKIDGGEGRERMREKTVGRERREFKHVVKKYFKKMEVTEICLSFLVLL